jgi:hypothetical protein
MSKRPSKRTPAAPPTVTTVSSKAEYQIVVNGSPRDFKVREKFARATAAIIKRKHPDAEVMLRELETGEVTVIDQPSNLAASAAKRD